MTAERTPTTPQGLTDERFVALSMRVREAAGQMGDDIRIHGSRAAYRARPDSDLDIAIRVRPDEFAAIARRAFGTPKPGSAKDRTRRHALETGKIQAGELGLRALRPSLGAEFGLPVDISVVCVGRPFDRGPWIPLRRPEGEP
ncbi:MAG TPA: nucleotidyltransferase domain-containing protein [Thermomicrobiales bacterium]|nr:nucleotidyltransferase domain-containing protein [Thermomicrobiales bacterium]